MEIDEDKCVECKVCLPYCPVGAITDRGRILIDQDKCVECGVCLRSGMCPTEAIFWPELPWPRAIRQAFSAVVIGYDILDEVGIKGYEEFMAVDTGGGRGTGEMKTNDVTGRYRDGEVGIAAELGRPGVGFYFRDLEKVAMALAKLGVRFESGNPVTVLLDPESGKIKYEEILNERALSAIVEVKVKQEQTIEILRALREVAKEIDSVITVNLISKCRGGKIPVKPLLEEAGISVRINGKTNLGLGRPLAL